MRAAYREPEFTGSGYAWTPIAGRVGFSVHAGVEYRADFSLQSDAMYVWARSERMLFPRSSTSTASRTAWWTGPRSRAWRLPGQRIRSPAGH
jgi:hypothetical protein